MRQIPDSSPLVDSHGMKVDSGFTLLILEKYRFFLRLPIGLLRNGMTLLRKRPLRMSSPLLNRPNFYKLSSESK